MTCDAGYVAYASGLVAHDPWLPFVRALAAAKPGNGPGDGAGMMELVALRDQKLAGGGTRTFIDEALNTLGTVGQAARSAMDEKQVTDARSQAVATARDSLSGVSAQDEMQRLQQFQYASEASTKFLSTVNELLHNLVNRL